MHKLVPLTIAALLAGSSGHAQHPQGALTGSWALRPGELVDPDPRKPSDRVLINLTNEGAKAIFDAMPVPAIDVDCLGERSAGLRRKVAGGLECSVQRNEYHCVVAIMLRDGTTRQGYVCD